MKSIQKEQILRVNCPGFGEENYFTVGKAKALDAYKVIIVNPVSVFHLFDKDLALQKEIDLKLADGLTNLTIQSDTILQSIQDDLKSKRILELVSFLEKGGLLIYYLCRPFLVQGDNIAIDNYSWLESLAPDSSPDDNIRHMSAVSHGRIVEATEHTEESGFGKYFAQSGLEWNTIIRTDFLTEGYIALATAGPRKCIAGQLVAGDQGGRIIFLPAPFSPDFDKTLIECINVWHNQGGTDATEAPAAAAAPAAPAAAAPAAAAPSAAAPAQTASPRTTNSNPVPEPASPRASATGMNAIPEASPRTSTTSAPSVTPPASPATSSTGGLERVPSQFTSVSQNRMPAAKLPEPPSSPHANPSTAATSTTLPSMMAQGTLAEPSAPRDPMTSQVTAEFDADAVRAFLNSDQAITGAVDKGFEARETAAEKPANADSKPSAVDILKELEALSMGDQPQSPSAEAAPKTSEPASALNRNLFEELETLAQTVPSDKQVESQPSTPEPAAATPAVAPPATSNPPLVPAAAESKELNAHLNQMAESLAAQADAKRAFESQKAEQSAPPPPAAAPGEPVAPAPAASVAPQAPTEQPIQTARSSEADPSGETNFKPDQNFDSSFQFESDFTFSDLEKEFSNKTPKETDNHKEDAAAVPPTPEAKDLIKKMEEISKTMAAPDWAVDITFPDVEELKKERMALTESIKQAQTKIASIDNKIAQLEALKNALLGAEGEDLANASVRVFNRLGWNAAPSGKSADEFHLSGGGKADFIAKVVKSATQAQRSDLSSLASSVVEFWDKNEVEPKGILVACTWASKAPTERTEPDFAEGLAEFAQKKGLCLMTTTQLLCIYRDIEMGKQSTDEIRKRIEETNGRLPGFQLSAPMAKV